jgi:hypothetical protein
VGKQAILGRERALCLGLSHRVHSQGECAEQDLALKEVNTVFSEVFFETPEIVSKFYGATCILL